MKKDFWLDRWERDEIGFHQSEVNPHLSQFWPKLHLARDSLVFVPLCGKSRDMKWLHEQGHKVLAVELSVKAVQTFFKEYGHAAQHLIDGKFERYEANGICILCGDFFELDKTEMSKVCAVYDRASLIALPTEMRASYVRHLMGVLSPKTKILLITVEYPQAEMDGPPFSVTPDEVERLYRKYAHIQLLANPDVLAQNPRFQKRNLSRLKENVFLLTLY